MGTPFNARIATDSGDPNLHDLSVYKDKAKSPKKKIITKIALTTANCSEHSIPSLSNLGQIHTGP